MVAKILLVEDNPLTLKGLSYLLERENYQVDAANTYEMAKEKLNTEHYALILLDISLPDGNGFNLVQSLREENSQTPFIFITARDDEADIVHGLELGADDYVTKPFRNRELLLRVRNALNRRGKVVDRELIIGDFSLNLTSGILMVAGETIPLTALERRLLACLMENAGRIVTRERLLDEIWDASGKTVNDNTLSVYLKRLRSKLGNSPAITTIKNVGYCFAPTPEKK